MTLNLRKMMFKNPGFEQIKKVWDETRDDLEKHPLEEGKTVGRVIFSGNGALKIFAIVDSEFRIGLRIESDNSRYRGGDYEHFDIVGNLQTRSGRPFILLFLKNPLLEDVFINFCSDLVEAASSWENGNGVKFLQSQLEKWHELLKRSSKKLSEEKEIGLFGELVTLEKLLKSGEVDVIEGWKGPLGAAQDFLTSHGPIEVKTVKSSNVTIKVSSLEQLDFPPKVLLTIITLDQDESKGISLFEQVEKIGALLKNSPNSMRNLVKKLELSSYRHEEGSKNGNKWVVQSQKWFDTSSPEFPSLRRSICPPAIEQAKYQVRVSSLSQFEIPTIIEG